MGYLLLDPKEPFGSTERQSLCAMAIMAKAPRPGKVKTRLSPPLTLTETAALNVCFLRDTAETIHSIPGAAGLVCYTPVGDESAFDGLLPDEFALVAQRGDGFGERLLAAAQDILRCGYRAVCLIDSDSPTLPREVLAHAVAELQKPGDRVVLGPSNDGGYYLIGLKTARAEPFNDIAWSTERVAEQTRERCREAGLETVDLPMWYDVDDAASLATLEAELLRGERPVFATVDGGRAEATRHYLQTRAVKDPGTSTDVGTGG